MAQSNYLRRVNAINRNSQVSDVERGLQAGEGIGKSLSAFASAIQDARKNAIANQLMTQQDIANQPNAGKTIDLGTLDGGPQPASGGDGSGSLASAPDPDPDPIPVTPQPTLGVNPDVSTGDDYTFQDMPDTSLGQSIAANRLQGASNVPVLNRAVAASRLNQPASGDFVLNPSDYTSGMSGGPGGTIAPNRGAGTVGALVHSGGTVEMQMRQEAAKNQLADQIQKLNLAKSQRDATDAQAEDSGTGKYALNGAIKRAQLQKIQADTQRVLNPPVKPAAPVKNSPAVSIGTEPVVDQNQLNNHIDSLYGKGSSNDMAATLSEPPTIPDPNNPTGPQITNPNAPVVTGNSVTVGPAKNRITMPLGEAKIYTQQANVLRIRQGLPPLPVPGEGQSLGATADNPYPARTNLDVYSRPPGSWVRLPNNRIAQVPQRRQ